jgi:threonine dehydratase
MFDVTVEDVEAARTRIAGRVRRTPTCVSPALSARLGVETLVKHEGLQLDGCFKLRGVLNKLLQLSSAELARGIVTVSGGNHAIATARAATTLGAKALVLTAKTIAPFNARLTEAAGGALEICEDFSEAFARAEAHARAGMTYVHPIDDPAVIAGHGTVGLELVEDAGGPIDHVFVAVGGGGFASGVGAAVKGKSPATRLHGVETEGADTMARSFAVGGPTTIKPDSIARTLCCPMTTPRTYAGGRAFLDEITVVSDREAVAELLWILQEERVLVEPAAACVLAAALRMKPRFAQGERVALVLCGSNVALEDVAAWKATFAL